ncbi:MAG: hypothetical protein Q8M20_15340 [Rhodocyclaceae bacterium]|nr:hypothetical protein [Rhodocyclaceae bacterium]MDZ4215123.1 hypothetical protein [Rhodocyclaceae bacterium]
MPKAVIEDWSQFEAFLAGQPLCQWSAKKQSEVAAGLHSGNKSSIGSTPKDDNADLLAALSSMA